MDQRPPSRFSEDLILYQDNHILAVHKPSELATMGTRQDQPSLHALVSNYLKQKFKKPGNAYVGVVSRLDTVTGGIIVLAKTSKAARRLNEAFSSGAVDKRYLAIVSGRVDPPRDRLVDLVKKNDSAQRMVVCRGDDPHAKRAELTYRVLGISQNNTLLEVHPVTGRKHQIRLQLSHRQHPILGDRKYGSQVSFPQGIALFAQSISLIHPVRKTRMTFAIDLPNYWKIGRFGIKSADLDSAAQTNRLS